MCSHLVQMDRNTAGVSCKSGDREVQARLEVQKGRSLVYMSSEPPPETSCLFGKLTWDPAGLAVVPYLPCAPAGQALVPNALA